MKRTLHILRWTSFKGLGVDLEVEGVRYIEMHRGPHAYMLYRPASFKGRNLDLEGGVMCPCESVS